MFVHGEQADTILASLLPLMAPLQPLSRRFLVRFSFVRHALSSPPSLVKSPRVLRSYAAHPEPNRRQSRVPGSEAESCKKEVVQKTLVKPESLLGSRRVSRPTNAAALLPTRRSACSPPCPRFPTLNPLPPSPVFPPCLSKNKRHSDRLCSLQVAASFASYRIPSHLPRRAMDEQLYEGGRVRGCERSDWPAGHGVCVGRCLW